MVFPRKKKGFLSRSGVSKKTKVIKGGIDEEKLNQMVRERAYFLWEEQGRPTGQDINNWIMAEKEVRSKVGR